MGADAENLCKKIRNQEGIYREDWEYLYAKTQDLLLTDVANESLKSLLSIQREYEGSEYSVYIILMTLHPQTDKDRDLIERGFRIGASPLDREDAFERLPDIACNVQVSQCLSPKSYQDRGFYQC
ncbi:MAG: hypothetical protein EA367_01550 [Leptolyngbya sp. DLM2.Bin15]|nr:MAG: hypothetical protein EA367_01550 [Leptolyngbya sp. DLM2.Bin15]